MFETVTFNPKDFLHLAGAGALVFVGLKFAICLLSKIYKTFLASPLDLAKFKGKWAVVTGSTDGIGKAFAMAFARKGLNVVLISRSQAKLDTVAQEIRDKHQGVEVRTVAVDFIHDDVVGYKLKVASEIEGLEIGVLVNNVGVSYSLPARFLEMEGGTDENCDSLVKCNVLSLNAMTSLVLPQMVDRKSGVVINVSSFSGASTTPYLSVYSATKAYVDFFSRGLALEYSQAADGITVQCLLPGYVVSKLSKIRRSNLMTPYPDQYVRSALARLGVESRTTGYWVHDIMLYATTELLPQAIADKIVMSQLVSVRKRALKKQQQSSRSKSD